MLLTPGVQLALIQEAARSVPLLGEGPAVTWKCAVNSAEGRSKAVLR